MLQKTITLRKNAVLKVKGPVSFTLEKGAIRIFGFKAKPPFKHVIPSYKSIPIVACEDSCLNMVLGEGANVSIVENDTVCVWENIVGKVLKFKKPLTIMVIGTVDSGKSSLTTLIANIAVNMGFKTSVIDADIGQSDIGPPTFVSLGVLDRQVVFLSEIKPVMYSFIGTTTPYRVIDRVILSILKLLTKALNLGSQVIVINTDGWFKGRKAVEAKLQTILHIKPHVVFIIRKDSCIDEADLLYNYLNMFNINVIIVEAPKNIKERSINERKSIRESLYSKYFYNAKVISLNLKNVVFMNLSVLGGRVLSEEEKAVLRDVLGLNPNIKIVHATMVNGNLIAIIQGGAVVIDSNVLRRLKETYGHVRLKVLNEYWEKGLIVSLLNEKFDEVGIGYIEKIDLEKDFIKVRTNYEGKINGLIVGNIKLMYDEKTGLIREWSKWSL